MQAPLPDALNNIKRVAVVGAGISGVCSAAHLLRQGLEVTVFERSGIAGGVWHYDPRPAPDPSYPNESPSKGDYNTSPAGQHAYATPPPGYGDSETDFSLAVDDTKKLSAAEIEHAPPGPAYFGLKNNVPTRLMKSILGDYPEGTEDFVSQKLLEKYIQDLSRDTGVDQVTLYNTRVEDINKDTGSETWTVRTLVLEHSSHRPRFREQSWVFDAVVVASGHYNMPRIPAIPGLAEWKATWPDRVMHSKRYRTPEPFASEKVFLIGAGVSSWDIARELDSVGATTIQSCRGGIFDIPETLLPSSATRVGEVAAFENSPVPSSATLNKSDTIPGRILLSDGTQLEGFHRVIVSTGYITSYPFLAHLHEDSLTAEQASDDILVTADGDMVHNLYADIFYIPDPTLAFVGVPFHVATFALFDVQAQAVARAFAGRVSFPDVAERRAAYEQKKTKKGVGRSFHSLKDDGAELGYADSLRAWVNRSADELGDERMPPYTEEWLQAHAEMKERLKALRIGD